MRFSVRFSMRFSMRRVVVTGMGVVTPLGSVLEEVWQRLLSGQSGIAQVVKFRADDFACRIGGEIFVAEEIAERSNEKSNEKSGEESNEEESNDEKSNEKSSEGSKALPSDTSKGSRFANDLGLTAKERRRMDPFVQYAVAAGTTAIADSGYVPATDEARCRAGVVIGSGIGGVRSFSETSLLLEKEGTRRIGPFVLPYSLINILSGEVAIRFGLRGPNYSVVSACATGAHALGEGARLIATDDADVMVVGGAESSVERLSFSVFSAVRALSTGYNERPEEASRPWDKARDGFVMSEGAGVLVLEEYEHAKRRGARVYAELRGYGLSGDAYHITAPDPSGDGPFRAMQQAFRRAGLSAERIGYGNAHSTSTPLGDDIELRTIERIYASAAQGLSVSSTKSSLGHTLGAAGALEAIFAIKTLLSGDLPPTLNLFDPSVDTAIDRVALTSKHKRLEAVFSNSFGFGGTNACLVFARC